MNAPFLKFLLFLIAGIIFGALSPIVDFLAFGILCFVLFFVFFRVGWLGLLFLFCFGFFQAQQIRLERKIEEETLFSSKSIVSYLVRISSVVEEKPRTYKTYGEILSLKDSTWKKTKGKILLYFNKDVSKIPSYGDIFLVGKSFEKIESPKNFDEFDYQKYLNLKGVFCQQYLRKEDIKWVSKSIDNQLINLTLAINANAKARLNLIENLRARAVANAMLLGVRDAIEPDLLRAYSAAGAVHTLSVSGMHVGIIFWIISVLLSGIDRKYPWFYAAVILCFLWGYALITGLSLPVIRSALMLSLFVLASAFRRENNSLNTWAIAGFVQLVIDPFALFEVGFQLSYLAVLGLILLVPPLLIPSKKWPWLPQKLYELTVGAVAAQLLTFPLVIFYFNQFPTYFLVVNPLVWLFSSLGLLIGMAYLVFGFVPLLGEILLKLTSFCFETLNACVFLTESLPKSIVQGLYFSGFEVCLWYVFFCTIGVLIITRKKIFLWMSLFVVSLLAGHSLWQFYVTLKQEMLVVHHIKKQSGISIIHGHRCLFMADSSLIQDKRTHGLLLTRFWAKYRCEVNFDSLTPTNSGIKLFTFKNKNWLWVKSSLSIKVNQSIDYLLISHNSLRFPEDALVGIKPRAVVMDATNSSGLTNRWRNVCKQNGVSFFDVRNEGAKIF